ncbi:MAG: hypothetical protein RIS70_1696 [Planctomycetota bacterium]|jgi:hypothetical protein
MLNLFSYDNGPVDERPSASACIQASANTECRLVVRLGCVYEFA